MFPITRRRPHNDEEGPAVNRRIEGAYSDEPVEEDDEAPADGPHRNQGTEAANSVPRLLDSVLR